MRERLTKNTFVFRAKEIHGDKYDYSKTEYVKAKEPVTIICRKHGEFTQRPQDHILKACGCPKCKGEKTVEVHSYTKEKFLELAKQVHGDKYDYNKVNYINYITPITIICPIHGEFEQVPKYHISGTGCPKCGREQANKSETLTKDEFVERANKIHFGKYDYSKVDYINNSTKVCIICPEHGEFWQTPGSHLQGQGCPKCKLVGQTKLYNRLKQQFPQLEIIFEAGNDIVPWIGNQRIDIYIPSINYAIELNGPQHYEEIPYFKNGSSLKITQERDALKRKKCKDNKCRLIELKYYYTDKEFQILINEVTQKLEELEKKFYSDESTQEETDECALEAGKLLVNEILYNTQDNSGKLLK